MRNKGKFRNRKEIFGKPEVLFSRIENGKGTFDNKNQHSSFVLPD